MPAEAERRLAQFAAEWRTRGARAWGEGWWDTAFRVGDLVGGIVGAPPGSTVMHQNVTVAEAIVLSCFDLKPPRNRIVFEEGLFPSVRYVQQAWARFGAEVVVCPDAEAVIDAIDERTLLVPVSHVLYKSAEIQPIEAIAAKAHSVGAHVCLDAYQSAGAVPLDVTALGIAFCVGGSVKWLCGGPGAGWLYVRPDLAEQLEPAFAGWQAHARPFAFEDGDGSRAGRRRGSSPARRSSPRTTRRARATRSSPRSASTASARTRCGRRRCSSSSSTTPASSSPHRASLRCAAARSSSASRTSRRCTPSSRGATSSATRGPMPASASARTSSPRTTRSASPCRRCRRSSPRARTSSGRTPRPGY